MGIFSFNSPFMSFLTKVMSYVLLYLLSFVCSIPIVTIGASTTARYYVGMKMVRGEEPAIVKQGSKYGVKIKATAPSIHMIRANIETEISPLVGNENQASDLIKYIGQSGTEEGNIWGTNIFGKSIEELVEDGIKSKVYQIGEESQVKLQETMQKIVNDSNGGMVCIII